jgi:2-dehydro-3-deoxyphosphogluconate aldolase/(4S)-4-hydroxy-2-oxoglutarate aldolase
MAVTTRPLVRRAEQLRIFAEDRLVAVIRTVTAEDAVRSAHAVAAGGVRLIEITMTVPDADEVVARLTDELPDRVIGAGTVLSRAQAEAAMLAGARFLVSPCMLPELVEVARAHDGMSMLGTLTPTEIIAAARAGSDFIKIFPVQPVGGPTYVSALTRALRDLPLVATGTVELAEIPAYFGAGCVGFGVGTPMTRPDLVTKGDLAGVTRLASEFLAATRRGASR